MNLKLKRTPGVYLVGFMASGKSTVGRASGAPAGLELLRHRPRDRIRREDCHRRAVRQRGEPEFRRIEARNPAAARALDRARTAGGAGARAAARSLSRRTASCSREHGVTVWLDCPFETVQRRVAAARRRVRPLARDPEKFAALVRSAPRDLRARRRARHHRERRSRNGRQRHPARIRSSDEHPPAPPPRARDFPRRRWPPPIPDAAVARHLQRSRLGRYRKIYVVGAGKAGASMAQGRRTRPRRAASPPAWST